MFERSHRHVHRQHIRCQWAHNPHSLQHAPHLGQSVEGKVSTLKGNRICSSPTNKDYSLITGKETLPPKKAGIVMGKIGSWVSHFAQALAAPVPTTLPIKVLVANTPWEKMWLASTPKTLGTHSPRRDGPTYKCPSRSEEITVSPQFIEMESKMKR